MLPALFAIAMGVLVGANVIVMWSLASAAAEGALDLGRVVTFAQSAFGASMIAFGGLTWAMDGVAAPKLAHTKR